MARKHLTEEGPVTLTDANKLYLYSLLRESVGCGRQVFMPRVLEALGQAGLAPENLGYESAEALFAKLGDFCQLTTFKGGRHYVTVTPRADWDEALAAAEESKRPTGKGGKPWKRKKGAVKPVRPKTREPKVVEEVVGTEKDAEAEKAAEAKAVEQVEKAAEPEAPAQVEIAEEPAEPAAAPAVTADPDTAAATQAEPVERAGVPSILDQIAAQTPTPAAQPAEPAAAPEPPASPEPPAVPAQPTTQHAEPAPTPLAAGRGTAVTAATAHTAAPRSRDDLPRSFADEVSVKPAILGLLTRLLPIDADMNHVLDEDLRVARATGTCTGSRNLVTFPLRYLQEDGSAPLTVTIRRQAKAGDARRWQLTLVDGDDGTGSAHEAAGIEGLPQAEGGCWAQLSAAEPDAEPIRELAQFMEIGTWEGALGTLATAATPEKWNYPGEGVGKASRYGVLRDYLASTLARVRATGALTVAADGSLAALDTGLATSMDEELYAVLSPTGTDIPWHLDGFATAGSGELGARLSATLPQLPARASYLADIDDVAMRPEAMVIPDYRSLLSRGLDLLPRGFVSQLVSGSDAEALVAGLGQTQAPVEHARVTRDLARAIANEPGRYRRACRALDDAIDLSRARARRSYRYVAPAYDAARDRMLLLLPLALVDDARVDCALALELMPSGAYQAASVVSLSRAYACARVVSAETPAWLAAADVLA